MGNLPTRRARRGQIAHPTPAGSTFAKVKAALAEGAPFHLEGLRAGGEPVPGAGTVVEWVEV